MLVNPPAIYLADETIMVADFSPFNTDDDEPFLLEVYRGNCTVVNQPLSVETIKDLRDWLSARIAEMEG